MKSHRDFHPDFIAGVDNFCDKFRTYLSARGFTYGQLSELERSFGGNVYFSLSGHGCGFRDDRSDLGKVVNEHLIAFSGNKYRFEQICLSNHRRKLDLAFRVEFVKEYRDRMFYHGLSE